MCVMHSQERDFPLPMFKRRVIAGYNREASVVPSVRKELEGCTKAKFTDAALLASMLSVRDELAAASEGPAWSEVIQAMRETTDVYGAISVVAWVTDHGSKCTGEVPGAILLHAPAHVQTDMGINPHGQ